MSYPLSEAEQNEAKALWSRLRNNPEARLEALSRLSPQVLSQYYESYEDLYRLVSTIARSAHFQLPPHRKRRR